MRLYFHILRAHAGPFVFALITVMFIFLLQFIMKFIDQLVGKGLSMWVIGELMTLSLAWMVVLAVPMAVLVSTLMGFGTLSSQNEIAAMKASGMSLYRMIAPVAIASLLVTYGMVKFNNDILPEANHRVKVLMVDIRRQKPTLTIVPGLFSQDISGYSILARKTFEHSNDLEGVTIFDYTDPSTNVVVTARRGTVSFTPDYRKLILDLYDGEIHRLGTQNMQEYRKLHYEKHRIIMNAEGFDFERSNENAFSRGDRELSAQAMQQIVDSLEQVNAQARDEALRPARSTNETQWRMLHAPKVAAPTVQSQQVKTARVLSPTARAFTVAVPANLPAPQHAATTRQQAITVALNRVRSTINSIDNQISTIRYNQDQINQYLVEINKKYSLPVACFVFVFIGAPLGIMARRGSFGVAASLSVGFFLLYWASLIGGEKLADRGLISPWIGMWMADIFLGVLGMYLTFRMARETPTINWLTFRRFVPRYLRAAE
jgi:lipopolysaccharide export system permease protein